MSDQTATEAQTASGTLRNEETLTMVSAINQTLMAEMHRDERVMVFGEDVALSGGVFRATEGLLDEFGQRTCCRYATSRGRYSGRCGWPCRRRHDPSA